MKNMITILRKIPDPRQPWKVKHTLAEILLICILGVTANAESSYEIFTFAKIHEQWLKRHMPLENGIPSRLTFERVLRILDPKCFTLVFTEIMRTFQEASRGSIVAIDGKAYHNTREAGEGSSILYLVHAWCAKNGMTLAFEKTQQKSNEITAIPELLAYLEIKGATVTIDAIGCQHKIVEQIVKKNKADYVISLKENQRTMLDEMERYAQDCLSDPQQAHLYTTKRTCEKAHGRIETRTYRLFHDLSWFPDRKNWANLRGLIMVERTREIIKTGVKSIERQYYITSHTSIDVAANAVREHWGVENKLHWVLDVVFKEDDWKTKHANSATNLAVIRRFCNNLLRAYPDKNTAPIKRYICSLNLDYLEDVVFNSLLFS